MISAPEGVEEYGRGIVYHNELQCFIVAGEAKQLDQPSSVVLYKAWVLGATEVARVSGISPSGVALDNRGRIIVAGTSPANEVMVMRFNSEGQLDSSFGDSGIVTTGITDSGTGERTRVSAVAVDVNNHVLVTGTISEIEPKTSLSVRAAQTQEHTPT